MFDSLYQNFSETADPSLGAPRLKALRASLRAQKLDGFLVPRADAHQNEYVAPCEERLAWLTGFTGSAGFAVVLRDKAALFVDGRYTIQAREQVDADAFAVLAPEKTPPAEWLAQNARKKSRIGYDPWLHTPAGVARYEEAAKRAGADLVAIDANPIDALWRDRPAPPRGPVAQHPLSKAGEKAEKKLSRIRDAFEADVFLISDPHDLAWAFNLRGADLGHTPIALGFALIFRSGETRLFFEPEKLSARVGAALAALADIASPQTLPAALAELGKKKRKILFDSGTAAAALTRIASAAGAQVELGPSPIARMKALKNACELDGARAAHLRDGVALTQFLCWFDAEAPKGKLTEISAALALEHYRRETGVIKDLSFPTISAFGAHAALPHYRVTEGSNARIGKGVYLVDSGAQYLDGTTDVTRTVTVGTPSKAFTDAYTRVLKGHIAIARAVFPHKTVGAQLDALARLALWRVGLDFDHGVGHGVGSYLSVHEGPQRIAKMGTVALEPGMILSNEPGYYREGAFGIRIENLVAVEPKRIAGAERDMLGFETLTLAPIDTRPVDASMLDAEEKAWLNAYHARVRKTLSPLLSAPERAWLKQATAAV
ncbi:M24 family metallopeptidase [Rhodoblastus acidophilus]|uniref:M24 family metallopeptidase n=1 Tax=Rhodoblastus acidophilus TaxID=1074 RepID=A0A6N8DK72_RHOAC|nr:aminopeptidase P family protein [Rhodoblastus acidophilus]MCW2273876.1 Xaa-Pro aminopeptidase [Rhodoblastus acidophilus]MTV30980.1 M24 family metallopeptidase [Rhodoblastus acidophilus]